MGKEFVKILNGMYAMKYMKFKVCTVCYYVLEAEFYIVLTQAK